MNNCLISTGYPPENVGGIGTYINNLAEGFTESGHKVFVITQTRCYEKEEVIDGVKVYRAKSRFIPKLEKYIPGLAWSAFVSRKIVELDKKFEIDKIEFPNWEGVAFWYLLKKNRKPVVVRLHTPYFETLLINKNRGEAAKLFQRFLFYSFLVGFIDSNRNHCFGKANSYPHLWYKIPELNNSFANPYPVPFLTFLTTFKGYTSGAIHLEKKSLKISFINIPICILLSLLLISYFILRK